MSRDLCEEMTVAIFSRLPTKSLLRFRAVSKSLRARIGSPDFIRLHALRSQNKFVCIHNIQHKDTDTEEYISKYIYTFHSEDQPPYNSYNGIIPIPYPFTDLKLFGSCNGLLCHYASGKGVTLWNPSTRRLVTIRDPRTFPGDLPVYGFGYDPVIHDYKIVRISQPNSFVCTLKTRVWRKIVSPTTKFHYVTAYPCLFNGALHQVVKKVVSFSYGKYTYYHRIMTLDFSSEVFSSIELPEPTWEKSGLSIIKGSLAVMSAKHNECKIWVRRESDNTAAFWSVSFKLDLETSRERSRGYFRNYLFLYCDIVERFFQVSVNGDLLLDIYCMVIRVYNRETHVQSELAKFCASSNVVWMSICGESLELLDIGTSCDQGKQISGKKVKAKR